MILGIAVDVRPDDIGNKGSPQYEELKSIARRAEVAKVDFILLTEESQRREGPDVFVIAAALAAVTREIGIVISVCISDMCPYHFARDLAALDQISGGRIGWRPISDPRPNDSVSAAGRAAEFIFLVRKLWNAIKKDAFMPRPGTFITSAKIEPVNHLGQHFTFYGVVESQQSPQGEPPCFDWQSDDLSSNPKVNFDVTVKEDEALSSKIQNGSDANDVVELVSVKPCSQTLSIDVSPSRRRHHPFAPELNKTLTEREIQSQIQRRRDKSCSGLLIDASGARDIAWAVLSAVESNVSGESHLCGRLTLRERMSRAIS